MNVPLSASSDTHGLGHLSPVDSPYTNARSPSGHLVPYSPAPARRHSRDYVLWMTGSQTSLHNEPGEIGHADTSQTVANPILLSGSSTTVNANHDNHTPVSDVPSLPGHPPNQLHRTISLVQETSPGLPEIKSSSPPAHLHFDTNKSEPHRSTTPLSMNSSRLSVSQKSFNSRNSIGRASYREHRGPPARARTPALDQGTSVLVPSPTLRIVEPSGSAAFPTIIAPPSTDDPDRPGEPINVGPRFCPMSVSGVLRYDCRETRSPSDYDYKIEAMAYTYPETPEAPEGWEAYRHPEGALYFVHGKSKTFTEVNICEEEIYEDIEYFRRFLFSELEIEIKKRDLPESLQLDEVQLVLEPKRDGMDVVCCYYFVNPQCRSLFWLDGWEGFEIFKDCRGVLSSAHKGLAIQEQYWCVISTPRSHWDLYPNFCEVTQELKDELVDMILHATCDHLTSNRSSSPLNPEELKNHLSLIERIDPEKTEKRKHAAIVISRVMCIFYRTYFLNFHGENCARLNFDQAVHGWRYHPSLLMTVVAPVLFMVPMNNVRLLHRIFVDDLASKEKWNMFVTKLNSQLQETSVLATVLLNANVAFLPQRSSMGTSSPQFLSYMSLVASMASIILGLVFMGHIRTEARNTPFEAAKFLNRLWQKKHGLETLAIIYSLPHAFLMWGMCFFSAAFAIQWCYPSSMVIQASAGAFMFLVALLVAWCIWIARDRCNFWWFQPDPSQVEHKELEEDEKDGKVPRRNMWGLDALFGFRTKLRVFKPVTGESHAMRDTTSATSAIIPGLPVSNPEPSFWANSQAA